MTHPDHWDALRTLAALRAQAPPLEPAPAHPEQPLSFPQERLWFLDQLNSGSVYNLPFAWRLRGALDREALARAFDALVQRHDGLRVSIRSVKGTPIQVAASHQSPVLRIQNLEGMPAGDEGPGGALEHAQEFAARSAMEAEARRRFDLARGPLFTAQLLCFAANHHVLIWNVHHIVYDGWSHDVLVRELSAYYEAFRGGLEMQLPDPAARYADFAVWQRAYLASPAGEQLLGHWKQHLAGSLSAPVLPFLRPESCSADRSLAELEFQLGDQLSARVMALAHDYGTTPFTVLWAVFQGALYSFSAHEDFFVCSPVANRALQEVEGIVGYFTNLVMLRSDLAGAATFDELLSRSRRTIACALAHQDLPVQRLHDLETWQGSLSRVLFALHNTPGSRLSLAGVTAEKLAIPGRSADFDLYFSLTQEGGRFTGTLSYNTARTDAAGALSLVERCQAVLERAAANVSFPLSALAPAEPIPIRPLAAARPSRQADDEEQFATLSANLGALPPDESRKLLTGYLQSQVKRLTGIVPHSTQAIADLRLDSLKLIELANRVRTRLGIDAPVAGFLKAGSIEAVADDILRRMAEDRVLLSGPPADESHGHLETIYL